MKQVVQKSLYLSTCVHDLNGDSRLWEIEAFYTKISPVLICQTVPVRRKVHLNCHCKIREITTVKITKCDTHSISNRYYLTRKKTKHDKNCTEYDSHWRLFQGTLDLKSDALLQSHLYVYAKTTTSRVFVPCKLRYWRVVGTTGYTASDDNFSQYGVMEKVEPLTNLGTT